MYSWKDQEGRARPEEKSEKAESCRENLWNEIQLNEPWRQKQKQEQNKKRSGQAQLVYFKNINRNIPTTWRWAREDLFGGNGDLFGGSGDLIGGNGNLFVRNGDFFRCNGDLFV